MDSSQFNNKKVAIFGINNCYGNFVNFLLNNNVSVVLVDTNLDAEAKNKNNISAVKRSEIVWNELECLVLLHNDTSLTELAAKNDCPALSQVEFFTKYFISFNYTALVGNSGSSITSDIIKYVLCRKNQSFDYEICKKECYFTIYNFGKTKDYIIDLNENLMRSLHAPHFNNIIIFDLNYSVICANKIKEMLLNQTDEDFLILNMDNADVKILYNTLKDNGNFAAKIVPISVNKILKQGISYVNNEIYVDCDGKSEEFMTNEFINLTGRQNKTNILSAFAYFFARGYDMQEIIENMYSFQTSNDIFEIVMHRENLSFINDINNRNKSQSLIAFDNIYWILCADDIDFEFSNFLELKEYFNSVKYVFIVGQYSDELLSFFRENQVKYYIMYDMKSVFNLINGMIEHEKKEEKITILLSSINNLDDNEFYEKCSGNFEKLINAGGENGLK